MNILILGNGFDLDLGLKTRYSDFAMSSQWEDLYRRFSQEEDCLAKYLYELANKEYWFDIEQGIADYVKIKEQHKNFSHANEDRIFFLELKKSLGSYLLHEMGRGDLNIDSLASKILDLQYCNEYFDHIYTFNYTDYDALCALNEDLKPIKPVYIHNSYDIDGSIILGIGDNDSTSDEYDFLKKTNQPTYKPTDILRNLINADEVVIFGHSINKIDSMYYEKFFEVCSEEDWKRDKKRHIILIDLHGKEQKIKKDIRSVNNNFLQCIHFCDISFLAANIYHPDCNKKEQEIEELIKMLKSKKYGFICD